MKKKILTLFVAVIMSGVIFAQNNCVANFSYGDSLPNIYYFWANNQIGDQNTWVWDFGDGNVSTNNNINQCHTYSDTGIYEVCLTVYNIVSNDTLCSDIFCENIIVNNVNCAANFEYYHSANTLEYHFYANNQQGTQNTWAWDFGDGNVATGIDIIHTYSDTGIYHVCLNVYNININNDTLCSDTYCKNINIDTSFNCVANFEYADSSYNDYYNYFFYANNSQADQNTWVWDFGDGSISTNNSMTQFHTYPDIGTYEVCLTVYYIIQSNDTLCSDTYCESITIHPNCISDFYYNSVNIFEYHFHANQTGDQNTWFWDFDDGNTETGINPVHTYADTGIYHVCLTVYDTAFNDTLCSDTYCENIIIDTTFNCVADFYYHYMGDSIGGYHFHANNQQGDQNTWFWNFGDGNIATGADIVHTYTNNGVYQACLTVYDIQSNDTLCSDVNCVNIIITDNSDTIINPLGPDTLFVDTITTNPVDSCIIDYMLPVDSAFVDSFTVLDSTTVLVVWIFWQNGTDTTITVEYSYIFTGSNIIYLTIYCGSKSLNSTTVVDVINIQYEDINNDITENEINSNSSLIIYPNPVIDNLNIKANLKYSTKLTLTITNIIGQQIETCALTLSKGEHLIKLPVNNLLKGIYLINITSSDGKIKTVRKFVK